MRAGLETGDKSRLSTIKIDNESVNKDCKSWMQMEN